MLAVHDLSMSHQPSQHSVNLLINVYTLNFSLAVRKHYIDLLGRKIPKPDLNMTVCLHLIMISTQPLQQETIFMSCMSKITIKQNTVPFLTALYPSKAHWWTFIFTVWPCWGLPIFLGLQGKTFRTEKGMLVINEQRNIWNNRMNST